MTEIRRVDGIFITAADARYLAESVKVFDQLAKLQGMKLTQRLRTLGRDLDAAVSGVRADVAVRSSESEPVWLPQSGHDLYGTADAARILGCSESNVRDLARRGTIPSQRSGGRWLLDADAVRERAAR